MIASVRSSKIATLGLLAVSVGFLLMLAMLPQAAQAQRVAKYGADFLAGGVGARALGMGGAHVALTQDVNAAYWNPSGLSWLSYPEIAYMHSERFGGVVSFDYGAAAFPVTARSTVGLAFFRSGVNDIKNTLDAWDFERDNPKANPDQYITTFSAADYAFFVGYSRMLAERLSMGVTGKVIRRTIGDFADAWGYSFDVGVQYRTRRFVFGANVQDASTMLQSWSINTSAFDDSITDINPDTGVPYTYEELFDQELPAGGTFLVLPVARLGSGVVVPVAGQTSFTVGLDMDLAFDGQQANVFNAGDLSFHPRIGGELNVQNIVYLRGGINRVLNSDAYGMDITPSVGAGLRLRQVAVDYGFGDFAGLSSEIDGYTHRISVQLTLEQPGLKRSEEQ